MKLALILGLIYILMMPIIFRLVAVAHKKLFIDRKAMKMGNNRNAAKNLPQPKWPLWKERISFTMKDKRDFQLKKPKKGASGEPKSSKITNKQMLLLLWATGLALVLLGALIGFWQITLAGYAFFFIAMAFGVTASDSLIRTREKIYGKMFNIAKQKLGQSAEYAENPRAVITVLEWADYIKPQKAELLIPDNFSADGAEGFFRQWNQIFGTQTTWVPLDDQETGASGWDFEEGKLTIYAVPPLPQMAPWDEHYVLAEGVAWSFFPIALGVENGIELPNPKTGEIDNILGFDLSGEQSKYGEKYGIKVSGTITTSPMVLCAGGTGGGKSLAVDTWVEVIRFASSRE